MIQLGHFSGFCSAQAKKAKSKKKEKNLSNKNLPVLWSHFNVPLEGYLKQRLIQCAMKNFNQGKITFSLVHELTQEQLAPSPFARISPSSA